MKLLGFLLIFATVSQVSSFERYTSSLRFARNSALIIENASEPLIIGEKQFFWDGFYKREICCPVQCEIKVASEEWILGRYAFKNGSQPTSLRFGCPPGHYCSGFSCHSGDVTIPAAIIFMVFCIFVVVIFKKRCFLKENIPEGYEMTAPNSVYLARKESIADGDTIIEDLEEEEDRSPSGHFSEEMPNQDDIIV